MNASMKVVLLVSAFQLFSLSAFAQAGDLAGVSSDDIRRTEQHRDQLVQQQKAELAQEKADHLKISNSLALATTQLVDLQKKNDALAATANSQADTIATQRKTIWWYRLHWWGAWIALALGLIACAVVAVLKFTGRLAIAGAKIGL